MNQIKLTNEIIELRPIQTNDVESIFKASQYKEIWEHMSDCLLTKEAVCKYVRKAIEEREAGVSYKFVVVHKELNTIIGSTSFLDIADTHKRLEIGATWLQPQFWRTNVNTMCKYLLLQYCFEQMQLNRVQIKTGHENLRSQKAIERLGATKEGYLRNHMIQPSGKIRHTVMYSITKEDWPTIKQKFSNHLLVD